METLFIPHPTPTSLTLSITLFQKTRSHWKQLQPSAGWLYQAPHSYSIGLHQLQSRAPMPARYTAEAVQALVRYQFMPPSPPSFSTQPPTESDVSLSPKKRATSVPVDALSLMDLVAHANTIYISLYAALRATELACRGPVVAPALSTPFPTGVAHDDIVPLLKLQDTFTHAFGHDILGPSLFSCLCSYVDPSFEFSTIRRDVMALLGYGRSPYCLERDDAEVTENENQDMPISTDTDTGADTDDSNDYRSGSATGSGNHKGVHRDVVGISCGAPFVLDEVQDLDETYFHLDPSGSHRQYYRRRQHCSPHLSTAATSRTDPLRRPRRLPYQWQLWRQEAQRGVPPVSHVAPLLVALSAALWNALAESQDRHTETATATAAAAVASLRRRGLSRVPWLTSHHVPTTAALLNSGVLSRRAPNTTAKGRGSSGDAAGVMISYQRPRRPAEALSRQFSASMTSRARRRTIFQDPFSVLARDNDCLIKGEGGSLSGQKRPRDAIAGPSSKSTPLCDTEARSVGRLPAEVLQHILEYVTPRYAGPVLATVSRQWHHTVRVQSPILRFYAAATRRVTRAYVRFFEEEWGEVYLAVGSLTTIHRLASEAFTVPLGHLSAFWSTVSALAGECKEGRESSPQALTTPWAAAAAAFISAAHPEAQRNTPVAAQAVLRASLPQRMAAMLSYMRATSREAQCVLRVLSLLTTEVKDFHRLVEGTGVEPGGISLSFRTSEWVRVVQGVQQRILFTALAGKATRDGLKLALELVANVADLQRIYLECACGPLSTGSHAASS